jgi:hypothetical protein
LRIKGFLSLLLVILVMHGPVLAQGGKPPAPEPVVLTDELGQYPLGFHLDILEDSSGELTIDQVASPEFDARFTPSQVEVPNFGFTNSTFWVRLHLRNQTPHTDRWLLEQGFANTHYVDLYTPLLDGEGYSVRETGVLRPAAMRDIPHPRIIFTLDIPPGSEPTYYLRFQNGASMTLPLTLWSQAAFINHTLVELILMGIFYGVLESVSPDANIHTGWDSFWYSIVTITTVGYGDRYPVTVGGRITAMFIMFMGVGIIGALASILSSLLVGSPSAPAD